ncbi:MAG: hypothetical protein ACLVCI_03955 [Varibaculum timonense]
MEHSVIALIGSLALLIVAVLLIVWTVVFYQSASRLPILTFNARRQENLRQLLETYHQRILILVTDPCYSVLDFRERRRVLAKILINLSQQYYRTAGWGNYHPQQLLATDWPELATLVSALPDPGQTPRGGRAQVSPSDTATLTAVLAQISYRSQLHAHALNTRQDLVIKPPRRSRFWIVPVTLTVLCLLVVSGLQTHSWALEQQAVRADRQGNHSLAQDLRLRQADSRLLADRWLVNYNLGTTYLNAGDLQNATIYLSRASKKMPFILEAKMTEPQAVLAGCQVNYNLALTRFKSLPESKPSSSLEKAAELLIYCNQAALKERQKYWKAAEIDPGSGKVASQLHQLATDSDELLTQIQKLAGDDFLMPHPLWFEDFLADEDAQS